MCVDFVSIYFFITFLLLILYKDLCRNVDFFPIFINKKISIYNKNI